MISIGDWKGFVAEDFTEICTCARKERNREHHEHMSHCAADGAYEIANAILEEKLKAAPCLRAKSVPNELIVKSEWSLWSEDYDHTARLVNIEKVSKTE